MGNGPIDISDTDLGLNLIEGMCLAVSPDQLAVREELDCHRITI